MRFLFALAASGLLKATLIAAPFQNLGFDDGNTNNPTAVFPQWISGKAEDFLPGWRLSNPLWEGEVGVNARQPGFGYVTLWTDQGGFPPVEGRFSLDIVGGPGSQWTLSQTGDIPDSAKAIHFISYDAHITLSINGQNVPLVYVPRVLVPACCGLPGYSSEVNDVYGDVSGFAGKTSELTFTTLFDPRSTLEPDAGLDSIAFVIPEPSTWALLLVGGAGLGVGLRGGRRPRISAQAPEIEAYSRRAIAVKPRDTFLVLLAMSCMVPAVASGAPFQNLGFDEANTNNPVEVVTSGDQIWTLGNPADYLPGWTIQDSRAFRIGINARPLGFGFVSLYDAGPPEGGYLLSFDVGPGPQFTLSQTGEIPNDAKAIHFISYDAHMSLSFNGQDVPLVYVPRVLVPACCGLPGYSSEINDVYGDVSAFAGKTGELSFTTLVSHTSGVEPAAGIDSIAFVIPEPSTWALLLVGASGLAIGLRRRHEPEPKHLRKAELTL